MSKSLSQAINETITNKTTIVENTVRQAIWDDTFELSDLIEVPEWVKIDSTSELIAIYENGAGGAAHNSVYFAQASEMMNSPYADDILDFLSESGCEPFTFDPSTDDMSSFASTVWSTAVEYWVSSAFEEVEEALEEKLK